MLLYHTNQTAPLLFRQVLLIDGALAVVHGAGAGMLRNQTLDMWDWPTKV